MEKVEPQIKQRLISDQVVNGLINFLESFFLTFPEFTWDTDPTKSRISIHDFDAFNLDSVDKRPRIAVELLESRWDNLVIDKLQNLSLTLGTRTISDLVHSSVTLHCVSKQSLEAKNLADIVFEAIRIFRPEIRKENGFTEIDTVNIGREQRVRTSSQSEVRVVPVSVIIKLKRTHVRVENAEKLKASGLV
jgi:hypothetical protein